MGLVATLTTPAVVEAACLALGDGVGLPCADGGTGDADRRKVPRGLPCSLTAPVFSGGGGVPRLDWQARFWQALAHFWARLVGSDTEAPWPSCCDRWLNRRLSVVHVLTTGTCGGVSFLTYLPATPSRKCLRSFFFDSIRLPMDHCLEVILCLQPNKILPPCTVWTQNEVWPHQICSIMT